MKKVITVEQIVLQNTYDFDRKPFENFLSYYGEIYKQICEKYKSFLEFDVNLYVNYGGDMHLNVSRLETDAEYLARTSSEEYLKQLADKEYEINKAKEKLLAEVEELEQELDCLRLNGL